MLLGVYLLHSLGSLRAWSVSDVATETRLAAPRGTEQAPCVPGEIQPETPCVNASLSTCCFYTTGFIEAVSTVNTVVFLFKKKSHFL